MSDKTTDALLAEAEDAIDRPSWRAGIVERLAARLREVVQERDAMMTRFKSLIGIGKDERSFVDLWHEAEAELDRLRAENARQARVIGDLRAANHVYFAAIDAALRQPAPAEETSE